MATRTISNSGGDWSQVGTWVEGAVPTSSDNVVATATSGNLFMSAASTCYSINLTNYVGMFAMDANLNVTSDFIFSSGMTYSGTGNLQLNTNSITASGKTFNHVLGGFQLNAQVKQVYLLSDLYTGSFRYGVNGATNSNSIDNYNIHCSGDYINNFSVGSTNGTTKVYLTGTGTIYNALTGVYSFRNNLDLEITGNYSADTAMTTMLLNGSKRFTVTAGTFNMTYPTVLQASTGARLNLGSMIVPSLYLIGDTILEGDVIVSNYLYDTNDYANTGTISSNVAGKKRKLTLGYNATQDIGYLNPTDIDSSEGQTIHSYNSTVTNTLNWTTGNTSSSQFFSSSAFC